MGIGHSALFQCMIELLSATAPRKPKQASQTQVGALAITLFLRTGQGGELRAPT